MTRCSPLSDSRAVASSGLGGHTGESWCTGERGAGERGAELGGVLVVGPGLVGSDLVDMTGEGVL